LPTRLCAPANQCYQREQHCGEGRVRRSATRRRATGTGGALTPIGLSGPCTRRTVGPTVTALLAGLTTRAIRGQRTGWTQRRRACQGARALRGASTNRNPGLTRLPCRHAPVNGDAGVVVGTGVGRWLRNRGRDPLLVKVHAEIGAVGTAGTQG